MTQISEEWVIKVIDEQDPDAYFIFREFNSMQGEVIVKVEICPSPTLQNTPSIESLKIGAGIQVFNNWARNRDLYHELYEKATGNGYNNRGFVDYEHFSAPK
ncbi:MAG: hypothetical protein V4561_08245 [Bacteroidota bacterium]